MVPERTDLMGGQRKPQKQGGSELRQCHWEGEHFRVWGHLEKSTEVYVTRWESRVTLSFLFVLPVLSTPSEILPPASDPPGTPLSMGDDT